jgi:protein O-mannosyl-transferase
VLRVPVPSSTSRASGVAASPTPGAPAAHASPPLKARAWQTYAIAAGLAALAIVAYSNVGHLQFVPLDDQGYIYENPHVTGGLTADGVRWALATGDQANWHPVTWLSHMLDVQIFGLDAGWHHLTSLALHALNTILLFGILARTTGAPGRSAFVAALFAVHPLNVESVAWVAERKNVLSTLFWLLTMGAYAWYARAPGLRRYMAVVVCLVLGLMSKPMLVTLPCVLLLLDVWPLGRISFAPVGPGGSETGHRAALAHTALALVREKIPLFLLAAASSIITVVVQSSGGAVRSIDVLPLSTRAATALTSYVEYLVMAAWPTRLAVFYPYDRSIPVWHWCGALAMLAAITMLVRHARRQRPYLLVGWFWYLGTLVPVIGLLQVGTQALADRYTYVPLIGVFVMLAWGAWDAMGRWAWRRAAAGAAAAAIVVACTAATRAQVMHWQDAWALWTHALEVTRDNEAAHIAVGAMLGMQGRNDAAVPHFREALRIAPESPSAHRGLGLALINLGQFADAAEHLSAAVRLRPDFALAHNDLGFALMAEGHNDEANDHFRQALRIEPDFAEAHDNLGFSLAAQGRGTEAMPHLTEAVRLKPGFELARLHLGMALGAAGRLDEAAREFREVLQLNPNNPDAKRLLGKLNGGMVKEQPR